MASPAIRVALFNDTGNVPHVGCQAVSDAHNRMLAGAGAEVAYRHFVGEHAGLWTGEPEGSVGAVMASPVGEALRSADAVVVNGEGTIHHGAGLHLMAVLEAAQRLGKPTFLVNAVLQDVPGFRGTLGRLNDLAVREIASGRYLESAGVGHRVVPDSILEASFAEQADRDWSGKVVITDHHASRADVGSELNALGARLGGDAVLYPLEDPARWRDWRHAVANLRGCRVVVTGRHHGVYLALMAGVPFVALPSNTWKIEGTLEMLGGGVRAWTPGRALLEATEEAAAQREFFAGLGRLALGWRPLTTLQRLHAVVPVGGSAGQIAAPPPVLSSGPATTSVRARGVAGS